MGRRAGCAPVSNEFYKLREVSFPRLRLPTTSGGRGRPPPNLLLDLGLGMLWDRGAVAWAAVMISIEQEADGIDGAHARQGRLGRLHLKARGPPGFKLRRL